VRDDISLRDRANTACLAAVPDVLETMFFELVAGAPEVGSIAPLELMDSSRVDFEGSARGYLVVAVASSLSGSLAEAFLALEDQGAQELNIEFVLGELANMLCGSALGRFQPEGTFRLSTPLTHRRRTLPEQSEPGFPWIRFPLDSGPLLVGLRLEASE
jgi:CheY-specific phosphatase CheX